MEPLGVERAHDVGEAVLAAGEPHRERPWATPGTGAPKRSSDRAPAAAAPPGRRGSPRRVGRPISALSVGGRALGHDPPVVDDPDAVGEDVGLLEVLRGQEDRDAVVAREPRDLGPERACGSAGRGRSWARRGRGCSAGARARAPGRAGASCRPSSVRTLRSAASVRPTRSSSSSARRCRSAFGDAVERRLQAQVLAAGEQRVERGLLERGADGAPAPAGPR